jgi:acyl-CoA reductase-like NAD-dependent aldehyde dehydrogenase
MAEVILERKEEIARLDALDVGKPYHSRLNMKFQGQPTIFDFLLTL